MTKAIEVEGFEELRKLMKRLPDVALDLLEKAMAQAVAAVQERAQEYPPSSEANAPGRYSTATKRPMGFWERGRGWWYPVMNREKLGKIGKRRGAIEAPVMAGPAGYKLLQRSERLGTKWNSEVRSGKDAIEGVLGNTASYADYVQGDRQLSLHAKRGWITLAEAVEMADEDIQAAFMDAADQTIQYLEEGEV